MNTQIKDTKMALYKIALSNNTSFQYHLGLFRKGVFYILLTALLVCSINLHGQDLLHGLNRVIPPSPIASELGKYGEIPVGLYTGIPNISVPLWEAKSRKLSLPISLSYHAAGNKVETISGWVGLGWTLNAGGAITRTVRGVADDGKRVSTDVGYYINPWDSLPLLENDIDSYGPWKPYYIWDDENYYYDHYLREIAQGKIDTEPDDFFFNFNGLSGRFVINKDGNPVIIPQQKIQIEIDYVDPITSNIKTWVITTADGIKYYFGGQYDNANEKSESAGTSSSQPVDDTYYYSTWYLYKIETPDGNDHISINYSYYDETTYRYPISHSRDGCTEISGDTLQSYTKIKINRKFIESISTERENIYFYKSSKFTYSFASPEYGLDSIVIRDKTGQGIKKFLFSYSEFDLESHIPADDYLSHSGKLKLEKIYEISEDGSEIKPPWIFEYDDTDLPIRSSYAQDHWGYFNGASNDHLIPPITIENYANYTGPKIKTYWDYDMYSFEDLTKVNITLQHINQGIWKVSGADRDPSEVYVKAGILTKIIYPTGGYTELDYELHDFSYFSTKKTPTRLKFTTDTSLNTSINLAEGQEVKILTMFANASSQISDTTQVLVKNPNGVILYSLWYKDFEFSLAGNEKTESVWLPPGINTIHAIPYPGSSDTIMVVCYYEPLTNKNKTYPIYSTVFEEEVKQTHIEYFPDDSAYYCSNTFQWASDDERLLTIDYSFRRPPPYHPNVFQGSPTKVRILDPDDEVIYTKEFWNDGDDTISGGGSVDFYLTGTKSILLEDIGTYTLEFIPRLKEEQGTIKISFNQAQEDLRMVESGGLRVKKVTTNDGVTNDQMVKEYSYLVSDEQNIFDTCRSSGILISYPFYYKITDDLFFGWNYDVIEIGDCFPNYVQTYSSSQSPLGSTQGSHLGYSEVLVKQVGNGSTLNKFSSALGYPDISDGSFPYAPVTSFDWKRGSPIETIHFDSAGVILSKELSFYNSVNDTTNRVFIPGLIALQKTPEAYADYQKYQVISGWNYLTKKINYTYDSQGLNPIVDTVKFYYENPNHLQLTKTVTNKSNGVEIINKKFYPLDFISAADTSSNPSIKAIALMKDELHMHNVVLEQQELIKENQQEKLVSGTVTKYKEWEVDQVLPEKIYQLETSSPLGTYKSWKDSLILDPNYTLRSTITKYDTIGHLLEYENEENIPVSYKWDYSNTLPVAKAVNSLYDSISGAFPNFQVPEDAQITVYKHIPLVGISEVIDENGLSTYYNYDKLGRLKLVKDDELNIINQYSYNYDVETYESVGASSISADSSQITQGDSTVLTIQGGSLGDGASWKWYTSSCGSTALGEGSSITVSPSYTTNYYVRAEGYYNTTNCVNCTITVLFPDINVKQGSTTILDNTGSFDFGNLTVDDTLSKIFTIENTGNSTLDIDTVLEYSNQFYILTQPASQVDSSSSTTFRVVFSPTSTGNKSTTLTIQNNDVEEDPYNFTIEGTGAVPEINVKQGTTNILDGTGSYDFGDVDIGSNLTKTFTIENTGSGNLTVGTVSENSDQFSITVQPVDLINGGDSSTFLVRFTPTSSGNKSATVTFSNGDSNENPYNFSIEGDGIPIEANFTYSAPRTPTRISFTDTSTGSPTSWEWDFDDDGTTDSTLQNPNYNFGSSGTYPVKLTIHKGSETDYIVKSVRIIIPE